MKKKLIALVSSVLVVAATAGTITALSSNEVKADGNAISFDSCVDIASDSWVRGGNGWVVNRRYGCSITSENIGVTLNAYAWDGAQNCLVWGGGGFPAHEGGPALYTGGDFAVSFAAEVVGDGFALVVDNYSAIINGNGIYLGYNDARDAFGDAMQDYNPAYWMYGAEGQSLPKHEQVALSGVVNVDAYVTTTSGVTTIAVRVNETVATLESDHARITGYHPTIVSKGMKVYSQKATEAVASLDKAVASLDEGEFKAEMQTEVANAKTAIWAEETLTSTFVDQKVNSVLAKVNEEKINAMLDSCVDIASDSWVSGGNGWRAGRFGGRTITDDTIGVKLGAYSWDGSAHWLVWGGGGFSTSEGLYTGGDFAVSFAAEMTSSGFAIVIDQFSMWVSPTAIKIGYDEQCGAFGDAMLDYAPAYWTTDLDVLHDRGTDVAQWFVQESVSLSGVVDIDAFVTTTDGVTTLGIKVGDEVVTATTGRTRVTGCHAGIMSQNGKVYSQKATEAVASLDKAVASLDEGEFKAEMQTEVANAKTAIWAEETLTSTFVDQKVNSVLAKVNEEKINAMLDSCVDIASDSWVSGGNGWRAGRFGGRSITSEYIGVTLPGYSGNLGETCLVWGGGGWPTHEGGRALYTGGDFAVSFAGDVGGSNSGRGFAVVVDQFSIWVSATAIKIGYDLQADVFGDSMNDYAPQQWTTDLDILHDRGSSSAQWFVQESVSLTGVVDIDAFVTTTDGVTTLGVRVGDKVVAATTEMERVTAWHTAIVTWGGKVYSQKATEYVASIDNAVAALDENVYEGEVKTQIDTVVTMAKEAIWGEATLTSAFAQEVSVKALRLIGIYASGALNTVAQWNATKDIVRLVSSIDSLEYQSAGFEITYNGQTATVSTNKLYTSFQYGDTVVTPEADWGVEGYLFAYTLRELPAGATFTVRAYWELEDGTIVYGTTLTVVVENA